MKDDKINGEALEILLVEDNPAHAELVIRSLKDNRVANKIYHVSNGEAALDYLHQRGKYAGLENIDLPHLILLDLHLPKINGQEVLQDIRSSEKLKDLIVVVLTSSAEELDLVKAYEQHANSYLVKPVDFNKFAAMMNDLSFYWLVWNHRPTNIISS